VPLWTTIGKAEASRADPFSALPQAGLSLAPTARCELRRSVRELFASRGLRCVGRFHHSPVLLVKLERRAVTNIEEKADVILAAYPDP
jgi:hypothetical protein